MLPVRAATELAPMGQVSGIPWPTAADLYVSWAIWLSSGVLTIEAFPFVS